MLYGATLTHISSIGYFIQHSNEALLRCQLKNELQKKKKKPKRITLWVNSYFANSMEKDHLNLIDPGIVIINAQQHFISNFDNYWNDIG